MRLTIQSCIPPEEESTDIKEQLKAKWRDAHFEYEDNSCLDIVDDNDFVFIRICDIDSFLAIADAIKAKIARREETKK